MEKTRHGAPLAADGEEMRLFLETIFKRCKGEKGWLALRAFEHDDERGIPAVSRWAPFGESALVAAVKTASEVASRSFEHRAVFSPPVCIFGEELNANGARFAGERNVTCAPALQVDLDKHPVSSLIELWGVLGQPTVIVATGGKWEGEDRLHAYWRLGEPARTEEQRVLLRKARDMALKLVGGDKSGAPLSHPMRWPGSWHTKGEPVLCRMTPDGDPSRDIKLQWAVEALDEALMNAGISFEGRGALAQGSGGRFKTPVAWGAEDLMRVAQLIPNSDADNVGWEAWNVIGMAFYDASHGSLDGLVAFEAWSAKSSKDRDDAAAQRWRHYSFSPPTEVSGGKLVFEARRVDPDFVRTQDVADLWFEKQTAPSEPEKAPNPVEDRKGEGADDATAADATAPGFVREMNKRHAFVMNKGKAFVANIEKRGEVTFSPRQAFFDRYANKMIADGKKKASEADLWWIHPQRSQFLGGVDFDPNGVVRGVFNVWRGFPPVPGESEAVGPDGAGCALMLRHIREVICNGGDREFRYLIRWLAHILQNPGEIAGVAVVLRGKKGTGKDTLGEYMGAILQHLYLPVSDPALITGSFNNHMTGKLLLHVEEAVWAGDKKAEGILKSRITASNMTAHPKGFDAFTVKSFLRVLMSSNEDWVAPATEDERRFFVLNVSDAQMQSSAWFGPIRAEMKGGGPAALAAYLRAVDLTGFDIRKPPATDALREQQDASLSDFALFWSELLDDETAFRGADGGSWEDQPAHVALDDLMRRYDRWREGRRFCHAVSRKKMGMLLTEYTGSSQTVRPRVDGVNGPVLRVLPAVGECRAKWDARFSRK